MNRIKSEADILETKLKFRMNQVEGENYSRQWVQAEEKHEPKQEGKTIDNCRKFQKVSAAVGSSSRWVMAEMRVSVTHTRSARSNSMNLSCRGEGPTKRTWPCLSFTSIPPMSDWGQILWVGNRLEAGNISRKMTLGLEKIIHKKYIGVKKNHQVLVSVCIGVMR